MPKRSTEIARGSRNGRWAGGKSTHPLIDIYHDMIGRCHRPTHARFSGYGGRGIEVCAAWRSDFWIFVRDMGPRPAGRRNGRAIYSLDRIDNDAGYGPSNCRWADPSTQAKNKRGWGDGELRRDPASGRYLTREEALSA